MIANLHTAGGSLSKHSRVGAHIESARRYVLARFLATWVVASAAALTAFAVAAPAAAPSNRVDLFPRLQAGQVLSYAITYHTDKRTKTRSSVVIAEAPSDFAYDVRGTLRLEILGVAAQGSRAVIHARSFYTPLDAHLWVARSGQPSAQQQGDTIPASPAIGFSIFPDGRIDQITGLDALSSDQQEAWHQWASRFAAAAGFPQRGIKPSQKWKSEEKEKSPVPIAGLTWLRESTYVRNEPCRPLRVNNKGEFVESDQAPETCAVILTTAALKQKSSTKDATPEDFRVRQLRTSGAAQGNNKTILYISLKTGLVVRSSDEANQSMNVTIAKTDNSNQVHYEVAAKSVAELFLISMD
jgi:hypothetical protein